MSELKLRPPEKLIASYRRFFSHFAEKE